MRRWSPSSSSPSSVAWWWDSSASAGNSCCAACGSSPGGRPSGWARCSPARRSRVRSGRRSCRRAASPCCCGRSLTGAGLWGRFVKCFTKIPPMRKVADSTVRRLSLYLRFLEEFEGQGIGTVSSGALASRGGTTSAQVRKDLSFFGSFGKRGLGYPVPELADRLREILGLKRRYQVAMVGAGKIGSALVQYRGFKQRGFDIVAIFDSDTAKIGRQWNGLTVLDVAALEKEFARHPFDMAVLVTPAEAAQPVTDRLVALGIKSILNFAPVQLMVPDDVVVKTVNLALELETLSYALANR